MNKNTAPCSIIISEEIKPLNKVDFTIGNNQPNNHNINNVGTSFFRMDQTYKPRSYDKSNKVLTLSQSQHKEITPDNSSKRSVCNKCKRTFKTHRGFHNINDHARKIKSLKQIWQFFFEIYFSHRRSCDNIWNKNITLIESKILLTIKLYVGKKCFSCYQPKQQRRDSSKKR